MKKLIAATGLLALLFTLPLLAACGSGSEPAASSGGLGSVSREDAGVTVAVTPQSELLAGDASWNFKVTFDTHTVDLSQDPAQVSFLIADGNEYPATAWEGSPSGGHHREGNLQFAPITPRPAAVELQIREVGGVSRSFNWTLSP